MVKKCVVCGKEFETISNGKFCGDECRNLAWSGDYPSVDHVIPLSKGGTHTWDNVKLAHKRCNSKKGNKDVFTAQFFV